jgi:hypothetical protein
MVVCGARPIARNREELGRCFRAGADRVRGPAAQLSEEGVEGSRHRTNRARNGPSRTLAATAKRPVGSTQPLYIEWPKTPPNCVVFIITFSSIR